MARILDVLTTLQDAALLSRVKTLPPGVSGDQTAVFRGTPRNIQAKIREALGQAQRF